MCKCNPQSRTPFCGAIGCEWPSDEVAKEYSPYERCNNPKLLKGVINCLREENTELKRKIEELEGKLKIATDAMQDADFNVLRDILYLALIKIKYDEKVII